MPKQCPEGRGEKKERERRRREKERRGGKRGKRGPKSCEFYIKCFNNLNHTP